jgi:hypothetical protein
MTEPTSDTPTPALDGFLATDQDGEGVQPLGNSGWLTVTIRGTAYRLRNPFFGELKKLRTALQAVQDEIEAGNDKVMRLTQDIVAHQQAIQGRDESDVTTSEKRKSDRLNAEARKASRELIDLADDRRMGWWTLVFATLSVDGTPPDWPSWVVDINLPGKVMEHWRSVPLAPGR